MGGAGAACRDRRVSGADRPGADRPAFRSQGPALSDAAGDDALAARVVAVGDRIAFGELVRRHQGAVRSFLVRLCRDAALADDLAQETFLRAYGRMAQYCGPDRVRPWLCGIAYREFLMATRRARARSRTLDHFAAIAPEAPPAGDPLATLYLDRALAALGEDERRAVLLCYAAGMSHAEAAAAMGAPLGTVKSWVNRGRDKLRERLEPSGRTTR